MKRFIAALFLVCLSVASVHAVPSIYISTAAVYDHSATLTFDGNNLGVTSLPIMYVEGIDTPLHGATRYTLTDIYGLDANPGTVNFNATNFSGYEWGRGGAITASNDQGLVILAGETKSLLYGRGYPGDRRASGLFDNGKMDFIIKDFFGLGSIENWYGSIDIGFNFGGSGYLDYPFSSDEIFYSSILSYAIDPNAAAVPEPSTFLLLGTGLGGLALWRRRRKQ